MSFIFHVRVKLDASGVSFNLSIAANAAFIFWIVQSNFFAMSQLAQNSTSSIYSELVKSYTYFNDSIFDGNLPGCLFTLQRKNRTYGYYCPTRFEHKCGETADEIALNPQYFSTRTVEDVLSTLVHEMVHQWQEHFGKPGRRRYHNKEWGTKMENVGLMPSNTGKPGGKRTGDQMSHYIIDGGLFQRLCQSFISSGADILRRDHFPETMLDPSIGGDDLGGIPKPKPTRYKYTHVCSSSEIVNIWGKEGLNVACGVCSKKFKLVE